MSKALVTGGNVGNYVAEGLAARGVPVRVLQRRVTPNKRWEEMGIEQITGDVADVNSLAPAFDDVDRFFSVTPFVENLVELGLNAIEAAKAAGVNYIVRSSEFGAGDTGIKNWRWHGEVEKTVEASGIPFTILQPNTFMQAFLMNADMIKQANAFYLPQADGAVSMIDVRDIAAVVVACLTETGHAGKTYELTGSESLSNSDVARIMTDVLGRKISYFDVTPKQAEESMAKAGAPAWMIQNLLELFEVAKSGQLARVSLAVEQILKRKPILFDQFLKDHRQYFQAEHGVAGVA